MWPIAIVGHLPSQPETEDASAVRLAHCLRGLEAINPLFSSWIRCGKRHRSTVPRIVTSPPDEAELRLDLRRHRVRVARWPEAQNRLRDRGVDAERQTRLCSLLGQFRTGGLVASEQTGTNHICRYRLRGACRPPEFRKPDRLVARRTADSRNDLEVQVGRSDTGWLAHPRTALWRPAGAIPERLDDILGRCASCSN